MNPKSKALDKVQEPLLVIYSQSGLDPYAKYNNRFKDDTELMCMLQVQIGRTVLNFGLVVKAMQNGFLSKGGSYDKWGMKIEVFRKIIPRVRHLIAFCRKENIPIFYTEAVRERSGIDLLTNIHMILPRTREERLKVPITVRGTWD